MRPRRSGPCFARPGGQRRTGPHHSSCHLWAYIPSQFAGDRHARYDFWADDEIGHLRWLGWPGRAIDQQTTSGCVDLGVVNISTTGALTVTLSNKDSLTPGWYAGAGDLSATSSGSAGAFDRAPNCVHVRTLSVDAAGDGEVGAGYVAVGSRAEQQDSRGDVGRYG